MIPKIVIPIRPTISFRFASGLSNAANTVASTLINFQPEMKRVVNLPPSSTSCPPRKYNAFQRRIVILRYLEKRKRRFKRDPIKYEKKAAVAQKRKRIRGRFCKEEEYNKFMKENEDAFVSVESNDANYNDDHSIEIIEDDEKDLHVKHSNSPSLLFHGSH